MDHDTATSAQQDATIPPAVLASSLLPFPDDAPAQRLLSLLEPLDRLTEGFCYGTRTRPGELVGVCVDKTTRSSLSSRLLHSLLASHLTATDLNEGGAGRAFYIDAAGNFSPRLLYESVLQSLTESSRRLGAATTRDQLEAKATTLLDNVSCMRVLDATGLDEAMAEVQHELMPKADSRNTWRQEGVVGDSQAIADSQDDEDLLSLSNVHEIESTVKAADQEGDKSGPRGPPLVLLACPLSLLSSLNSSKGIVHHNARLMSFFCSLRQVTAPPAGACVVVVDSFPDAAAGTALATRPLDLSLVFSLDRYRQTRLAWRLHVAKDRHLDRQGRQVEFNE